MFSGHPLKKSLAAALLALPLSASAIGVGNIDILSHLNQPLLARISILASPKEGIRSQDLEVRIASREKHTKYGLEYPQALKSASFTIQPQPGGNYLVRATTSQPIKEPLINFLLEVNWKNGRLFKEVALFLDPPGYQQLPVTAAQEPEPIPATVTAAPQPTEVAETAQPVFTREAPITARALDTEVFTLQPDDLIPPARSERKKSSKKRSTAKSATPRQVKPPRSKRTVIKDGRYGPVRPGDSLSKIAKKIAGRGASKDEIKALMQAIYVANPQAFTGSMDSLEKNSYLVIPSETDVSMGESYLATSAAIGISDFVTTLAGNEPILIDETSVAGPKIPAPETPPVSSATAAAAAAEPAAEAPKQEAAAPEEAAPAVEGELKILPPDQAAAEISRKLSRRMAELDKEASGMRAAPSQPAETVDNDPAIAAPEEVASTITSDQQSGDQTTSGTTNAVLLQEIAALKSERKVLEQKISRTEEKLNRTEETLKRLELKIEALSKVGFGASDGSFSSLIMKWLPWLLFIPLLPLLLFLVWRRRRDEEPVHVPQPTTGITAIDTPDAAVSPGNRDDIETVESASRGIPAMDLDLGDAEALELPSDDTAILASDSEILTNDTEKPTEPTPREAPDATVPSFISPETDIEPLVHPDLSQMDHELVAKDTQETMRPVQDEFDADATQIINHHDDAESDSSLNAAQEAEIYLAYGQYSLAEETINRLLALEPDNDRHKLLQLKLFAETSRMNELQTLSVELMQKHPDPNSGMHQQISNICERAFTKKAGKEKTLTDQDEVQINTGETPEVLPPLDITLDGMSVGADKLSATYADDIGDYMSEQTLADLDLLDEDNDDKTVFEEPLEKTSETAPSLELPTDGEDLTVSDLESLTVDLELQEAKLDMNAETIASPANEDQIEEFSDTDLRLEAIDLDDPKNLQSRLDISFDLESELEKHVTKSNHED